MSSAKSELLDQLWDHIPWPWFSMHCGDFDLCVLLFLWMTSLPDFAFFGCEAGGVPLPYV